ncbi:NUDIX domain-containing protein [Planococcus lenghuensis]|uniref:NUDIX hydrolase n=1 Tax=Planococcus lenghuensis TaxID=2213202 RepID=A0A1Q2KWZ6_9BACL|nr:NUDIX hydrolase [Planococcus lenghuensis]AQQ52711.1 NUDIX hydrolase [Planococcus lenghuensis]
MADSKRGNVWLGVAGLVMNRTGDWLVVKKRYSGLKGKWSLPAGFVQPGETIDEAGVREVKEETGIFTEPFGMIGFRSGVIKGEVSDNMAIFLLKVADETQMLNPQLMEVYEAKWMAPEQLLREQEVSVMLKEMAGYVLEDGFEVIDGVDPGAVFGYSSYKLFFKTV